jgi:hypothetical protein
MTIPEQKALRAKKKRRQRDRARRLDGIFHGQRMEGAYPSASNAHIYDAAETRAYREAAIESLREAKRRGGGLVKVEMKVRGV